MKKIIGKILLSLTLICMLGACQTETGQNPIVNIEMENGDKIEIELLPEYAPNTVANFVTLVEEGYYTGLTFHRIIPSFVIQGGDPVGDGTGGPGYTIKGEFSSNNHQTNTLKHERGVISMARSSSPDSGGSQFFIMVADSPHLDGEYAGFGKVTSGLEAVDKIVNVAKDEKDSPKEKQIMKNVTVKTFGKKYTVEKIKS